MDQCIHPSIYLWYRSIVKTQDAGQSDGWIDWSIDRYIHTIDTSIDGFIIPSIHASIHISLPSYTGTYLSSYLSIYLPKPNRPIYLPTNFILSDIPPCLLAWSAVRPDRSYFREVRRCHIQQLPLTANDSTLQRCRCDVAVGLSTVSRLLAGLTMTDLTKVIYISFVTHPIPIHPSVFLPIDRLCDQNGEWIDNGSDIDGMTMLQIRWLHFTGCVYLSV